MSKAVFSALALTLAATSFATAASITVTNPSFEFDGLDPNSYQANFTPTGYTQLNANAGYVLINDQNSGRVQSGKAGDQIYQFNNSTATDGLDQNLGVAIVANTTYTLSVNIGTSSSDLGSGFDSRGAVIQFIDEESGQILGSTTLSATQINGTNDSLAGTLSPFTTSFNSGPARRSEIVGDTLGFELISVGGDGNVETIFDNVAVTSTPEPASFSFLAIAGAGLLARRRR